MTAELSLFPARIPVGGFRFRFRPTAVPRRAYYQLRVCRVAIWVAGPFPGLQTQFCRRAPDVILNGATKKKCTVLRWRSRARNPTTTRYAEYVGADAGAWGGGHLPVFLSPFSLAAGFRPRGGAGNAAAGLGLLK